MVMVVVVIVGDNDDGISRRNALEVHAIALLRDPAALSLSPLSFSLSRFPPRRVPIISCRRRLSMNG